MKRNNKGSQWGNADIGASKHTNNSESDILTLQESIHEK